MKITKNNRIIELLLLVAIGLSANIGEQINEYWNIASKMFFIFCLGLVVVRFFRTIFSRTSKIWTHYNLFYWLFFLVVFFHITIHLFNNNNALSLLDLLEKYRIPLFMLFAWTLTSVFAESPYLLKIFAYSYLIGFFLMIPFGKMGEYVSVFRFCGTYNNPNTYAYDCMISVILCFYLLKDKKLKIIKIIALAGSSIMLLSTGSRGGLSSTLVYIVMVLLFTKGIKRKIAYIIIFFIIGFIILIYSLRDSNGIINRLFEESYSGNVRLTIWKAYLNNISKYFWFGIDESELYQINKWTPHNTYLGIIVRYGVFALIPYMMWLISDMIKIFKIGKKSSEYGIQALSSIIFACIVSGLTMENFSLRSSWILFSLTMVACNLIQINNDVLHIKTKRNKT